ncbi:MerR family transcriptional regulator [Nakamurella aerolata]|uniref:MerR family transcriptional regulator n=1 Tax=Nakamurella aerolata TaxID=1656892 RepID=A0A849A910_9ACTN|nr:MerR family transcriptional regulator [Nakamurella aerolata]NNG37025.1 MerR family transcriptional regulator [Nakamurella aerolata]
MRISEVAGAAGTTPRAVRHYHRLGILPEPERRSNGYRDYGTADLLRLMRVRWLADAGVPLSAIPGVLRSASTGRSELVDDLSALVAGIADQQAKLARQQGILSGMLEAAVAGERVSPLPAPLVNAFDRMLAGAPDEQARRGVRHDREVFEAMALRGALDERVIDQFVAMTGDEQQLADAVQLTSRVMALQGKDPAAIQPEIDAVAALLLTHPMVRTLIGDLEELPAELGHDELMLFDPAQRALVRSMLTLLRKERGQ